MAGFIFKCVIIAGYFKNYAGLYYTFKYKADKEIDTNLFVK